MVSQVLLLSQPRTACHLLERILSDQPNVQYLWHPIVAARPWQTLLLADEQASANAAQDLRANFEGEVRCGVARWEEALLSSQEIVSITTRQIKAAAKVTNEPIGRGALRTRTSTLRIISRLSAEVHQIPLGQQRERGHSQGELHFDPRRSPSPSRHDSDLHNSPSLSHNPRSIQSDVSILAHEQPRESSRRLTHRLATRLIRLVHRQRLFSLSHRYRRLHRQPGFDPGALHVERTRSHPSEIRLAEYY